jgi:hypothetical protein
VATTANEYIHFTVNFPSLATKSELSQIS